MADVKYDFIEYKKIFKDREKRLKLLKKMSFIPTPLYLRIVYYIKTGRILHLNHPKGFSEKIQWLKTHDIHPEYARFVDKNEAKKYIIDRFGEEYVFPCYGVWDRYDDIDFTSLPQKFVLKCTHDSGSIKIIQNKDDIDHSELKKYFNDRLIGYKNVSREYPYNYVQPRIMAEKLYEPDDHEVLKDYRFFCYNGVPKIFYIHTGRNLADEKQTWFDMDFNRLDIIDVTTPQSHSSVERPACFEQMVEFSKELSRGIRFLRVDLYEDKEKYYFSEMTFFPYGGFVILKPEKWEKLLGDWITLD